MSYVFFRGGPEAVRGGFAWETRNPRCAGCKMIRLKGADIPSDTFHSADPELSQSVIGKRGFNHTALLPWET